MKRRVGICVKDFHYSVKLMEYINYRLDIPFRMVAFSSVNAVEEYMDKNRLDLLLIDTEDKLDKLMINSRVSPANVKYMTSDCDMAMNTELVYMYQCADDIAGSILRILTNRSKGLFDQNKRYAVFSPVGRSGKTTMALGICTYYTDCLYIGMEDFRSCSIEQYTEYEIEKMEKFFYYLITHNESIDKVIEDLPVHKQGFLVVAAAVDFMDIRQVKGEDIGWFFKQPVCTRFKRIVIDVNSGAMSDINLFSGVDKVFIPVLYDDISAEKLADFRNHVACCGDDTLMNRITYIDVPPVTYDSIELKEIIEREGL